MPLNFFTWKKRLLLATITIALVLNILIWKEVFIIAGPHYLKVNVLDVGQGDSILIKTPAMRHIIIDGGPGPAVLGKLAKRLPFFSRYLDIVILTHPDGDHVMGLIPVLEKYRVDYIVWTGMVRSGGTYQKWLDLLQEKQQQGTKVIIATPDTKITNGKVVIDILHPFEDISDQDFGTRGNDTGIVSYLTYGQKTFLFTADISSDIEQQLIDRGSAVQADVLKVAHHGSRYSTSKSFLAAVKPSIAVISAGKDNSYGHPTQEVLQRLENFGIKTLRTDLNGDVEILSDGKNLKILK